MNLRPDQLAKALTRPLACVYLVSGDEPMQKMEATDLLRRTCREHGFSERETFEVDAKFDWHQFTEAAASMSLFAEKRVLDLRLPTARPGKQGSQALKQYLSKPPADTLLLISSGKLDGGVKNSAWYKAVEQSGVVIQCWPIGLDKLAGWVRARFQSLDMQADSAVVDYVCQHVEGNLLAAAQEIDKLHLLLGSGNINIEHVRNAVTGNSRFNVFELADCVLKGEQARAITILNGLRDEGIEPILILWALTKDIRLLNTVADNTSTMDYVLTRAGVWKNRLGLFRACIARHNRKRLRELLGSCAQLDAIIKGVEKANVWDELQQLSFRLTGASL